MTRHIKNDANTKLEFNEIVGNLRPDENTLNNSKTKIKDDFDKDMDGFIRLKDILQLIPICKSSWWQGVKEGRYPKQVNIGPRAVAWPRHKIVALVRQINCGEMKS